MQHDDDGALIARIRAGEPGAFHELYEAHSEAIYNVCLRIVGSREEAEDLTQETFLAAYRGIDRFREASRIATWLYRIATNLSLNHQRRRKILRWLSLEALTGEAPASAQVPPDAAAQMEERERMLWRAIGGLPDRQRAAIILNRFEGLSHVETAEAMACSISSVESLLHRAKRELREKLSALRKDG